MTKAPPKACIAAGHGATAEAAAQVLAAGGNAFDAVLAGFLAACVAEPVLASLGGGGFMTARTTDGAVETFDFFTQTPVRRPAVSDLDFHEISVDFGPAQQAFHIGLGAVATPGAVAGVFAIHEAFGRIPLKDIAAPAIALARAGVTINHYQAYLLSIVAPIYTATAGARRQFCGADGTAPMTAGDVYRVPAFADFLGELVREGPALFYNGAIAARIGSLKGCAVGAVDLSAYRVERRRPIMTSVAGAQVFLNPPPAIGGALIAGMMGLLDQSSTDMARAGPDSEVHVRAMVAAIRRCNQARIDCGIDGDPIDGAERLAALLAEPLAHPPSYRGTTHISIADDDGNLCALTVSNGEGCGHVLPGTGVMLNNMLGEEDLNAGGFFTWPTATRLSSMMAPGVMRTADGAWTAFGSGGSNRIRTALTQVIAHMAVHGLSPEAAVAAPRLHLEGPILSAEPGLSETLLQAACEDGEILSPWPEPNMFFGGAHVVRRDHICGLHGAADARRDGVVVSI